MIDERFERLYHEAVAYLITHSPDFANFSIFLHTASLEPISEGVAATDGENFYIGPKFANYSIEERAFIIAHELNHIILGHPWRMGDRDSQLWNIAGDFVDNYILKNTSLKEFPLPGTPITLNDVINANKTGKKKDIPEGKGILYDPSIGDWYTEKIYDKLERELGKGNLLGRQYGGMKELPIKRGNINGGDVIKNNNPGSEQEVKDKLREAVRKYQERYGKTQGEGDGLKRLLDAIDMTETLPWYSIIQRYVKNISASANYTWSPPKMVLYPDQKEDVTWVPKLKEKKLIRIAVAIDTSGSIEDKDMSIFLGNLYSMFSVILGQMNYKGLIMLTTDKVYWNAVIPPFVPPEVIVRNLQSGGTDFRPAFEMVDKTMFEPPDLFIYFTDGLGQFPEHIPKYPVIWVLTSDEKVPFGEAIKFNR